MQVVVREATIYDGFEVSKKLREWDRREALALAPQHTLSNLIAGSIQASRVRVAAVVEDRVIAVGGVAANRDRPTLGHPWMVGTDELYDHPITTVRTMRKWVREWQEWYLGLVNWVAAENDKAQYVLTLLGFTVGTESVRMNGLGFVRFEWGKC